MTRVPKLSISILFPAYNDEKSIASQVDTAVGVLKKYAGEFEVIVVDNGSKDGTASMLEQLRIRYQPFVRIVTHSENRGYGAALRTGFAASQNEFVVYTDGDGQYDVGELARLMELMDADVGLVNGYKLSRRDSWRRIAIGFLYNYFAKALLGVTIHDVDCNFRLIRREAVNSEDLRSTSETICVELVRMIELSPWRVLETGVHHYPRLHGRSGLCRIRSLATTFWQLTALYWRLVVRPKHPRNERGPGDHSEVDYASRVAAKAQWH